MTSSRITLAIVAAVTIVTVVIIRITGFSWTDNFGTPQNIDTRPTIIFVYTDDLDWETLTQDWQAASESNPTSQDVRFPTIKALADQGMVFTNLHVTTPVCGPSRACLLSGQYAHRNGVLVNQPGQKSSNGFPGGFRNYDPQSEFAIPVRNAGYQTCFVGKYVHDGFDPDRNKNETWQKIRPPGWEIFRASLGSKYLGFHTVDAVSGKVEKVEDHYRTDFETGEVLNVLDEWDKEHRAQLICWLSLAPHDDAESDHNSAARHRDLYADSVPPILERNADFRELNLPPELASLPRKLPDEHRIEITRLWHSRLRAIKALDEGLARIRERLRRQGRLENTIFVISSDHGFRMGEHGHIGKRLPYDRITRVPTIVCGPGIAHGTSHELLANIDFAPTLIEMTGKAGSLDDYSGDGRSFANLLQNPGGRLDPPREGVILENWEYDVSFGNRLPATWTAWRMKDRVYTEWATGGRECYDLATDPEQLDNLYSKLTPREIDDYSQKLRSARTESGPPVIAQVMTTGGLDFTEPQNGNFDPVVIDGFADCSSGVASIELELCSKTLDQYWSGETWTSNPVRVKADLGNPNGLISSWRYPIDTSTFRTHPPRKAADGAEIVDSIELTVSIFLNDTNGLVAQWTNPQTIQLHTSDPETWIHPIRDRISRASPIVLTGRAADETGIQRVRLIINDKQTGKFWNGSQWVSEYETVDATLWETPDPRHVDWRFEFTLDNNHRIYFGARAVDGNRNFDRTVSWFELEPEPETALRE